MPISPSIELGRQPSRVIRDSPHFREALIEALTCLDIASAARITNLLIHDTIMDTVEIKADVLCQNGEIAQVRVTSAKKRPASWAERREMKRGFHGGKVVPLRGRRKRKFMQ